LISAVGNTETSSISKLFRRVKEHSATDYIMASVAVTIFVALLVLGIIKLIQKYWNDLKFSKDFCGPALPIPLIGQVLPTLVISCLK